jgi:hypothetical protein
MKCNDARALLELLCDNALETRDSALVLDHLKSCAECQSEYDSLEQLRSQFKRVKENTPVPPGMMAKISAQLAHAERKDSEMFWGRHLMVQPPTAILTVAFLVLAIATLPVIRQVSFALLNSNAVSVQVVVAQYLPAGGSLRGLMPLASPREFAQRFGYDLRFLRLPGWHLDTVKACMSPTDKAAELCFTRNSPDGIQHLTCIQAKQGFFRAAASLQPRPFGNKQVAFGSKGGLQYAFFSQNGRDYLFMTTMSRAQLEQVVRDA